MPSYESNNAEALCHQDPNSRRDAERTLSELLACASEHDSAASPPADAEEWFRSESQCLLQWAQHTGRLLSKAEFDGLIEGFAYLDGGLEHQVFYRRKSGRVLKITKPPHFGHTWFLKDYVQNAIWCNQLFGDDIRLEGVVETPDGLSLVMSQPFIIGSSPSESQVEEWFQLQNASRLASHKWRFPDGSVVSDAHRGNLILATDGSILPIDVHIQRPT